MADNLTGLLKQQGADPAAVMRPGRFVYADGTLGRRPEGAVGVWVPGSPATVVALPGTTGFGQYGATATGRMMDYDGAEQPGAGDVTTRGMLVYGCDGRVARRFYLDLYPALPAAPAKLGAATAGAVEVGCGAGSEGPRSGPVPPPTITCRPGWRAGDRQAPRTRINRRRAVSRRRLSVRGRSGDRGCAGLSAVLVSVVTGRSPRCRFVQANGRLTRGRTCRRAGAAAREREAGVAAVAEGAPAARALPRDGAGGRPARQP